MCLCCDFTNVWKIFAVSLAANDRGLAEGVLAAAACMILGALSYIFFGSADVQYYNDPDWREKKKTAMSKNTLTVACTLESATMHRRPSAELAL